MLNRRILYVYIHIGVSKSKQLLWFQLLGVIWHSERNTLECLLMNCVLTIPYLYPNGISNAMLHYSDVIMGSMASEITSLTIVYSTVYTGTDKKNHQSSASLALVRGIHRWPVNSPHKWSVTRKMFPFDNAIIYGKLFSIDLYRKKMESYLRSSARYHCLSPPSIVETFMRMHRHARFPSVHYTSGFPPTSSWLNLVTSCASIINEKKLDILKCGWGSVITALVLYCVKLLPMS